MKAVLGLATIDDVDFVSAHLREADRREMAVCGLELEETAAAMRSALSEGVVFSVRIEDEPIMVFGLGPNGYVWGLGTDGVAANSTNFLRCCPTAIEHLRELAGVSLWTVAWRGNPLHMRWLRWCGFQDLGDHEPDRPLMMRPDDV